MKHDIEEIYVITVNTAISYRYIYCTMRYIKAHNVPHFREVDTCEAKWYYHTCHRIGNPKREATLVDVDSERRIYLYGEKTWFDTAVERDAYTIQANAKQAEIHLRTLAKKDLAKMIDNMSVEEVKEFMEKMGLW